MFDTESYCPQLMYPDCWNFEAGHWKCLATQTAVSPQAPEIYQSIMTERHLWAPRNLTFPQLASPLHLRVSPALVRIPLARAKLTEFIPTLWVGPLTIGVQGVAVPTKLPEELGVQLLVKMLWLECCLQAFFSISPQARARDPSTDCLLSCAWGESPEFPSDSLNTLTFHRMTDMAENTVCKQKSRGRTPNTVPNPHMQPCSRFVSTVPEQFPITALEMPGSWDGLGLCRNNRSRVQDQRPGLSKGSLRSLLWYRKQLTSSIEYIPDRMPSGSPGPRTLYKRAC
ncbi:hypothetical protein PAL_GLEAN10000456 [Pteropus alecto]|uniref:Uncharacterized protein n=1 Tax=Pteropus alecto TaxID=9402 RepID=L5K7N7_PTEAL|nr:hypothetical protein PAL_GLEAN10000456 [Pteropus alecto]